MNQQPNILLISADQLRWDFMGCAGAEWMNTPNLDRLAQKGMRFSVCVTNSPICVPARVGLATGRLPSAVGALDNAYHTSSSTTGTTYPNSTTWRRTPTSSITSLRKCSRKTPRWWPTCTIASTPFSGPTHTAATAPDSESAQHSCVLSRRTML